MQSFGKARPSKVALGLGLPAHLGGPPARAYQQKSPVGKEFRGLAFEGVSDELENPSYDEQSESNGPEAMQEDRRDQKGQGENDQRDADGVAEAVDGILVTGGVLCDP